MSAVLSHALTNWARVSLICWPTVYPRSEQVGKDDFGFGVSQLPLLVGRAGSGVFFAACSLFPSPSPTRFEQMLTTQIGEPKHWNMAFWKRINRWHSAKKKLHTLRRGLMCQVGIVPMFARKPKNTFENNKTMRQTLTNTDFSMYMDMPHSRKLPCKQSTHVEYAQM